MKEKCRVLGAEFVVFQKVQVILVGALLPRPPGSGNLSPISQLNMRKPLQFPKFSLHPSYFILI
jgi:hypothetical protein